MKIVHLHGFKCAGSTFSWILQRMYGNKLLYVESKSGNERLSWDNVNSSLNMSEYLGITSHTLEYPDIDDDNYFFVEFVRNPLDRIKSAYIFQRKSGHLPSDVSFLQYCSSSIGTTRENFMTRRLSSQTFEKPSLWSISSMVPISANNLFVGSVEFFDESLVLLEQLLSDRYSLSVDLSYPLPQNIGPKSDSEINLDAISDDVFLPIMDRDLVLSSKVNSLILKAISGMPDFINKLNDFRDRCAILRSEDYSHIKVKGPNQWVKL